MFTFLFINHCIVILIDNTNFLDLKMIKKFVR